MMARYSSLVAPRILRRVLTMHLNCETRP